jgi:hypothetical protein
VADAKASDMTAVEVGSGGWLDVWSLSDRFSESDMYNNNGRRNVLMEIAGVILRADRVSFGSSVCIVRLDFVGVANSGKPIL